MNTTRMYVANLLSPAELPVPGKQLWFAFRSLQWFAADLMIGFPSLECLVSGAAGRLISATCCISFFPVYVPSLLA